MTCGYCQSNVPCFDGKTMAGYPCQYPGVPEKVLMNDQEVARNKITGFYPELGQEGVELLVSIFVEGMRTERDAVRADLKDLRIIALTEQLRLKEPVKKNCPMPSHHPSCNCDGSAGDR